jgi:hypothetical protein
MLKKDTEAAARFSALSRALARAVRFSVLSEGFSQSAH